MESFFHELKSSVHSASMTDAERTRLRGTIARHMAAKPAGHGIPVPLWFMVAGRRTMAGVLAVVLVMGSTGGLTYASQDSLPTQPLYPVKLVAEEVVALTKTTPEARATYEIKRVEKRFTEVAELAQSGIALTPDVSKKVTRKISHHVARVNEQAEAIKETSASSAIETQTELATSIEAHRDALEAVIEAQPESAATIAPVLATAQQELEASETATQIAIAISVDQASQANESSDLAANLGLQADEAAARIASLRSEIEHTDAVPAEEKPATVPQEAPVETLLAPADRKTDEVPSVSGPLSATAQIEQKMKTESLTLMSAASMDIPSDITHETPAAVPVETVPTVIPSQTVQNAQLGFVMELETLLEQARASIATGDYTQALVMLQSIDQKITLQSKLQTVEANLQVEVPTSVIEVPIENDTQAKAESDGSVSASFERDVSAAHVSGSTD